MSVALSRINNPRKMVQVACVGKGFQIKGSKRRKSQMCTSKRNEGLFDVFPTKHIVMGCLVCSGTFSLSQPHFSAPS